MTKKLYTSSIQKTNVLSTRFTDGMVVEASDLTTAQQYPVDLFRTLTQAYFGCGIVCGFDVTFHPESARTHGKTRCIKVHPGTAIDCHGYPFRLCKAVEMKFEPEPCPTSDDPIFIYIAARRFTEGEQGREVSDDKCGEKPACVHARDRDMVEIRAFPDITLPENKFADNLCRITEDHPPNPGETCKCLKQCPCDCCGESWVLLAIVKFIESDCRVECIDKSQRRYVKPIHCTCEAEPNVCVEDDVSGQSLEQRIEYSAQRFERLQDRFEQQQTRLADWSREWQALQQEYLELRREQGDERLEIAQQALQKEPAKKVTKKVAKKKPAAKKTPRKKGG